MNEKLLNKNDEEIQNIIHKTANSVKKYLMRKLIHQGLSDIEKLFLAPAILFYILMFLLNMMIKKGMHELAFKMIDVFKLSLDEFKNEVDN